MLAVQFLHDCPTMPQTVSLVPFWHVPLASQQPPVQLMKLQPPEPPDPPEPPEPPVPARQVLLWQVWPPGQAMQLLPALPHWALVPGSTQGPVGLWQQPLQLAGPQVVTVWQAPETQLWLPQSTQVPPSMPQAALAFPAWQAPVSRHPGQAKA